MEVTLHLGAAPADSHLFGDGVTRCSYGWAVLRRGCHFGIADNNIAKVDRHLDQPGRRLGPFAKEFLSPSLLTIMIKLGV